MYTLLFVIVDVNSDWGGKTWQDALMEDPSPPAARSRGASGGPPGTPRHTIRAGVRGPMTMEQGRAILGRTGCHAVVRTPGCRSAAALLLVAQTWVWWRQSD